MYEVSEFRGTCIVVKRREQKAKEKRKDITI